MQAMPQENRGASSLSTNHREGSLVQRPLPDLQMYRVNDRHGSKTDFPCRPTAIIQRHSHWWYTQAALAARIAAYPVIQSALLNLQANRMKKVIETERLFFRELLPTDADVMFELDSDPAVVQYTGDKPLTLPSTD